MLNVSSIRTRFVMVAAAISFFVALCSAFSIKYVMERRSEEILVGHLSAISQQLASLIQQTILNRWNAIKAMQQIAADSYRDGTFDASRLRSTFDIATRINSGFLWIGAADKDGKVIASTGGILEGADVSSRPWFINGKVRYDFENFHEAALLAPYYKRSGVDLVRLFDLAAPIVVNGTTVGVIGAHLGSDWMERLRRDLTIPYEVKGLEAFLVDDNGQAIVGNAMGNRVLDSNLEQGVMSIAKREHFYFAVATVKNDPELPQFGWRIVARVPFEVSTLYDYQTETWLMVFAICLLSLLTSFAAAHLLSRSFLLPHESGKME